MLQLLQTRNTGLVYLQPMAQQQYLSTDTGSSAFVPGPIIFIYGANQSSGCRLEVEVLGPETISFSLPVRTECQKKRMQMMVTDRS